MKAEIITIGDELLIGQTIDTNSAWMGAELSRIGFDVYRITSVSDKRDDIIKVLSEASIFLKMRLLEEEPGMVYHLLQQATRLSMRTIR